MTAQKKTKQPESVTLKGDLTIQQAGSLKKQLLQALEQAPAVELRWGKLSGVDITAVQTLHSLVKTAKEQGKTLRMSYPLPEALRNVIADGGFNYLEWTKEN